MSKVGVNIPASVDLSTRKYLAEVQRVLDSAVEFGNPQNPNDDQSTTLANGTAHNGSLMNIKGSWVEIEIDGLDASSDDAAGEGLTCTHNLNVPVIANDEPNVRWIVMGVQFDGSTEGTWWDDMRTPGSAGRGGASPPTFEVKAGGDTPLDSLALWWFEDVTDDQLFFQVQMPHGWKAGTTIYPHVHWTPEANAAANECVSWGLEYSWANIGADFPDGTIIYTDATNDASQTVQGTTLVAGTHYISIFNNNGGDPAGAGAVNGISGTGKTLSSMLLCRLFRDTQSNGWGTDDYGDDAGLLELDFHYESDAPGSDAAFTKTTGYGSATAQSVAVHYDPNDTGVAVNSIPLRFTVDPTILPSGSAKVKVTLFFIPAVR